MRHFLTVMAIVLAACGGTGGTAPSSGTGETSSTATAVATEVAVGQPMRASDGRSVTVLSFKRGFTTGNMFDVPKSGHEYVQVSYALANGSNSEWHFPLFELKLIDANGQKYSESFVTAGDDNVDSIAAGGHVASASQVYEAPTGIAIDVAWTPSIFESTVFQTTLK